MQRVLVVGGGCTGACAAYLLRRKLGSAVAIEIWEKARGFGGRMTTTRQEILGETLRGDVGAQYLSADLSDKVSEEMIGVLLKARAVAEVDGGLLSKTPERPEADASWRHFAGVDGGVNTALKCLAEAAKATPHFERRLASLDHGRDGRWRARPMSGSPEMFDAVIIAVPGCGVGGDNLDKIHGNWEELIDADCNRSLRSAQHDHRHAVVLFLAPNCAQACDSFFGPANFEVQIDDDMVHLLAFQSRKTARVGGSESSSPVIVAHTTHECSRQNQRAGGRDQRFLEAVAGRVLQRYLKVSDPVSRVVLGSKVITWKQCHVTRPIRGSSAYPQCKPLSDEPPLVLAGDYFTQSSFTGCASSAANAVDAICAMLKGDVVVDTDEKTRVVSKGHKRPVDGGYGGGYGGGDGREWGGKGGKSGKGGKGKGGGKSSGKGKGGSGYGEQSWWASRDEQSWWGSNDNSWRRGSEERW